MMMQRLKTLFSPSGVPPIHANTVVYLTLQLGELTCHLTYIEYMHSPGGCAAILQAHKLQSYGILDMMQVASPS